MTDIVVAGVKGGLGKSITAGALAAGIHQRGYRVAAIDADPDSQSLYDWRTLAIQHYGEDFPVEVFPWSTPGAVWRRRQLVADGHVEHTVTDVGGQQAAMFRDALAAGAELIIPSRPYPIELRRLPAAIEVAREVAATNRVRVNVRILLVAYVPQANDERTARAWLADNGIPVMAAGVTHSVGVARMFGHWPHDIGPYRDVVDELAPVLDFDEREQAFARGQA